MNTASTWFLVLAALCIAGPYLLGVRPRTRRQWRCIVAALAFLAWILPLMASLHA